MPWSCGTFCCQHNAPSKTSEFQLFMTGTIIDLTGIIKKYCQNLYYYYVSNVGVHYRAVHVLPPAAECSPAPSIHRAATAAIPAAPPRSPSSPCVASAITAWEGSACNHRPQIPLFHRWRVQRPQSPADARALHLRNHRGDAIVFFLRPHPAPPAAASSPQIQLAQGFHSIHGVREGATSPPSLAGQWNRPPPPSASGHEEEEHRAWATRAPRGPGVRRRGTCSAPTRYSRHPRRVPQAVVCGSNPIFPGSGVLSPGRGQVRWVLRCPPAHDTWSPTDADLAEQLLEGFVERTSGREPTGVGLADVLRVHGDANIAGARWCAGPSSESRVVELVSFPIEFGTKNRDIMQYDLFISQA
jgi:hypothetical protein